MPGRLSDKVSVITGAASGQGRAAATLFAGEGVMLVLADVDAEELEEVGGLVRRAGADSLLHMGDLTRQIATQYGSLGIQCNAIAPGYLVYGPGERRVHQQSLHWSPEGIPLQRFTTPQDTANCALFLASDESSDITGQTCVLDGGRSAT